MKRVLMIAPFPPPITGQALISEELAAILEREYRVIRLDYSKAAFKQGNFELRRILRILVLSAKIVLRSGRRVTTYLTVSQSLLGNFRDLLFIAACRGGKAVLHLHGGGIGELLYRRHPAIRELNRMILRRVSRIVVLGPSLTSNYNGVVPSTKVTIIPNFVDSSGMNEQDVAQKHHKASLNILYLSNMLPGKGYRELLEAFSLLDSSIQHRATLVFAGAFGSKSEERRFLEQIERIDSIRYEGVVTGSRKAELFRQAQIFCLPSYYAYSEGQPVSVLEAYAHGCIVIATYHGGLTDIFQDGVNGLKVDKASSSDLVGKLERACEMAPSLRTTIGVRNLHMAEELFSRTRFEDKIRGLFRQCGLEQ